MSIIGEKIYKLASELFPIHRSITGKGVRKSLKLIQKIIPTMNICSVQTETHCFDWEIPKEWNIDNAYIITPSGKKIADFKKNNLHVVGYSVPVKTKISKKKLLEHVYTLPNIPDAIPYITSYYKERWGFCLSHNELQTLEDGEYEVYIDSRLENGVLNYGEIVVHGKCKQEILISTYICHPSMANNEVSGPSLAAYLAEWVQQKERKYTYRFLFIPETIGSIYYLSRHYQELQKNVIAGFNLTCVGDDRAYGFVATRYGKTLADKVMRHVLGHWTENYDEHPFLIAGSDERKYQAPGIDLPVVSFVRSRYGMYPEYHTSKDDMSVVSEEGFEGSYQLMCKVFETLEANEYWKAVYLCEPQLGKRGLYPTLSTLDTWQYVGTIKNILAYADGQNDLIDLADHIKEKAWELIPTLQILSSHNLIKSS